MNLMKSGAPKVGILLFMLVMQGGCATYYEDLMTTQQLISASCSDLATEEAKVESNIKASQEGSTVGIFGALTMAVLEGAAASSTGSYVDPNNSAAASMADGVGVDSQLATDYAEKKDLIGQLRAKRGCS